MVGCIYRVVEILASMGGDSLVKSTNITNSDQIVKFLPPLAVIGLVGSCRAIRIVGFIIVTDIDGRRRGVMHLVGSLILFL